MHNQAKLANSIKWLRIVIILTIVVLIGEVLFIAQSNIPLVLKIGGEYWSRDLHSFGSFEQAVLLVGINFLKVLWLGVLLAFWQLCRFYSNNKIFTVENARCFRKVGRILILMFLWDTLMVPLIGGFLFMRGIIDSMPDLDLALLYNVDYLVPGMIFLLIAKIMEVAATMREESDLTI